MNKSDKLAYWINERYFMKLRRDAWKDGSKYPNRFMFSDDPAMGQNRYCNVHREDDRVTKWLAENWRPEHHAAWEIVLARMVNYIPTLSEVLLNQVKLEQVSSDLKARRARGEKVFTSAYTISTCGKSMDKIDYVVDWVVKRTQKLEEMPVSVPFWDNGLAGFHRWLTQVDGLGSFLAAQVVADLKNTAGHPLQSAQDWWTWAAPGPGSLKGLGAFYGRAITGSQFDNAIKECWNETYPLINKDVPPIHMQDFQNCLCEFSKFDKISMGTGHARNRYSPGRD